MIRRAEQYDLYRQRAVVEGWMDGVDGCCTPDLGGGLRPKQKRIGLYGLGIKAEAGAKPDDNRLLLWEA